MIQLFRLIAIGLVTVLLSFGADDAKVVKTAAPDHTPLVGFTPVIVMPHGSFSVIRVQTKAKPNKALQGTTIPPDPGDGPRCVCEWYACMVFWPGCFV